MPSSECPIRHPAGKDAPAIARSALALTLILAPVLGHAASLGAISGSVDVLASVPGFDDSFGLGDLLGGSLGFDESDPLCPSACAVGSISLSFGSATVIDADPLTDLLTLDLGFDPASLDGTSDLGDVFGLTDVTISFGIYAGLPKTFVLDSTEAIGFASGTIEVDTTPAPPPPVVPLPPAGLALIGGLALAAAALRRRS